MLEQARKPYCQGIRFITVVESVNRKHDGLPLGSFQSFKAEGIWGCWHESADGRDEGLAQPERDGSPN